MKNETSVERASDRELVVTRSFNGPASFVFDAWTKPELLKRWWAPRSLGVSLFECETDLRVGGAYRYAFGRDPADPEVFAGRFLEFERPTRLVFTQIYERMRGVGEALVTITFEPVNGGVRVTVHQLYPSKQVLDGAIASGMERGMRETFEQLEELAAAPK